MSNHQWPIIAAAIGLPMLALLVVGGLWLLPPADSENPTNSEDTVFDRLRERREQLRQVRDEDNELEPASVESRDALVRQEIVDAETRDAVCNDGTPAAYYFREGSQDHTGDWLIFLQGGGGCGDEASCAERASKTPKYTSSDSFPDAIRQRGILSTSQETNPDFHDWNHVYIPYCSSDLWAGNGAATVQGETWRFEGQAIITAVVEDLDLEDDERVILTGSSAGGAGTILNLDHVASLLPNVDVQGFADSAFPVEGIISYAPSEDAALLSLENALDFQQWSFDETCIEAYPDDPSKCMFMDTLYEYLETPIYFFATQRDQNRMGNFGVTMPLNADEEAWIAETYVPAFIAAAEEVDGIYAPDESFHVVLTGDRFTTDYIGNVSVAEAFGNWYFDRNGEYKLIETE